MAKTYKLQTIDLRNEVNQLKADLQDANEKLGFEKTSYETAVRELDTLQKTSERFRIEKNDMANKVARLAEEGLIEASADIGSHDGPGLIRLIGRLEGHLRGIINAVGCDYSVKRDEKHKLLSPRLDKGPGHGSVNYKGEYGMGVGGLYFKN